MAATVKNRISVPNLQWRVAEVTLDASYPANGYALKPSDFGLTVIELLIAPHTAGYDLEWDGPSHKLKAFRVGAALSTPSAEVAAAVNLSAVTVRVYVLGY